MKGVTRHGNAAAKEEVEEEEKRESCKWLAPLSLSLMAIYLIDRQMNSWINQESGEGVKKVWDVTDKIGGRRWEGGSSEGIEGGLIGLISS